MIGCPILSSSQESSRKKFWVLFNHTHALVWVPTLRSPILPVVLVSLPTLASSSGSNGKSETLFCKLSYPILVNRFHFNEPQSEYDINLWAFSSSYLHLRTNWILKTNFSSWYPSISLLSYYLLLSPWPYYCLSYLKNYGFSVWFFPSSYSTWLENKLKCFSYH